MLRQYFQSNLQRTASAACRSVRFSAYCNTETMASRAGDSPRRPLLGYQSAKSSSVKSSSSRSRTHIAGVPRGLLARATRTVNAGIARPELAPIAIAVPLRPLKPPRSHQQSTTPSAVGAAPERFTSPDEDHQQHPFCGGPTDSDVISEASSSTYSAQWLQTWLILRAASSWRASLKVLDSLRTTPDLGSMRRPGRACGGVRIPRDRTSDA
jgi:hypothetical protein